MLDVSFGELLVILVIAVVVIGPKDLPLAMRTAGRWIGKMRRVSAHFRSGIDAMVREAELEEMEKKWKAQNEEIMRRSAALTEAEAGAPVMTGPPPIAATPDQPPASDAARAPAPEATPAVEAAPAEMPETPALPLAQRPVRAASVRVGGSADEVMPEPPREPMLPARPHTGDDDV